MKYALVYSHCWLVDSPARTAKVISVHRTQKAAIRAKNNNPRYEGSYLHVNILTVDGNVKKGDTIEERYVVKET